MSSSLTIRTAEREDVPALVHMLADDALGSARETTSGGISPAYYAAFDAIARDANNEIMVVCRGDSVVGMLQLTFTPSLSYHGGLRATIESVRTTGALRGQGIGTVLVQAAIERARERGCVLIQLSTHQSRVDAQRFYGKLGFTAEHVGMKLMLK